MEAGLGVAVQAVQIAAQAILKLLLEVVPLVVELLLFVPIIQDPTGCYMVKCHQVALVHTIRHLAYRLTIWVCALLVVALI